MTDQAPVPQGAEAEAEAPEAESPEVPEAVEDQEYACPFCGDMSSFRYRGKHFAQHRRLGDVPLPLTAEIVKNDLGTFDIEVTLTDSGKPVLVSSTYQGRSTKKYAEKALKAFMHATANGTGKPTSKKKITAVEVKDKKPEQPSATGLADDEILKALTKLTGVTSIPLGKLNLVLDWVEQTRTLAKEITR